MGDDTNTETSGITRREALRRGGSVLGGAALAWATPAITTVGISRALAASTSPADSALSFIALNVTCGGSKHTLKWEDNGTVGGSWDPSPGAFPSCNGTFTADGSKADGAVLGFSAQVNADGSVTIFVPSGCTVTSSAGKAAQSCCTGPTGSGSLNFPACP